MTDALSGNLLFMERRAGYFTLPDDLLSRLTAEAALSVFSYFIIVRAEYDFMRRRFCYTAYSDLFAPTPDGVEPPTYDITVIEQEDGDIRVEANRADREGFPVGKSGFVFVSLKAKE